MYSNKVTLHCICPCCENDIDIKNYLCIGFDGGKFTMLCPICKREILKVETKANLKIKQGVGFKKCFVDELKE